MTQQVSQHPSSRGVVGRRPISICLGAAATLTSLFITVVAGEERGVTITEKVVWVATGVVILLAAHLLPALSSGAGLSIKSLVLPIWVGAVLATGYTHATFFLNSQSRVGEQRASVVAVATSVPDLATSQNLRGRTQIAADIAATLSSLAALDSHQCRDNCAAVSVRRRTLAARLDALRVENSEAMRAEKTEDRHAEAIDRSEKAQANARLDPFLADLAALLRIGVGQVSLIVAVVVGWLVDAVAVVSWASVARSRGAIDSQATEVRQRTERKAVPAGVTMPALTVVRVAANEPIMGGDLLLSEISSEASTTEESSVKEANASSQAGAVLDLGDLAAAIRAGRVKTSLSSIRVFLGCTDGAAMALRRRLAEDHPDLFRPANGVC